MTNFKQIGSKKGKEIVNPHESSPLSSPGKRNKNYIPGLKNNQRQDSFEEGYSD